MISPSPQWSYRFLQWYCHPEYVEDVAGDLEEMFREREVQVGLHKARWLLLRDALVLCRPEMMDLHLPQITFTTNAIAMLRNYLIIAYRNLWHNKVYALINIFGLAIGLTAALFIFQYVQFERSYDSFHDNGDNIYRIILHATINGKQVPPAHNNSAPLGLFAKKECPEVLEYARLFKNREANVIMAYYPENGSPPLEFLEDKFYYVDPSFMEIFSFPMIMGDPKALQKSNTLLLSESMAAKFFGTDWPTADPIGKTLIIDGQQELSVQGVFKDIPENSHIKFEGLASYETLSHLNYDNKWYHIVPTYLQVAPQTDIKNLEDKLVKLSYEHAVNVFKEVFNLDTATATLQPVRDAHLHSFGYSDETEIRGSYTTVQFLSITAFFVLILAWINYVNLSTARAVKRAKEVGIRKVVGAGRRQLITQFLLEAFLINGLSLVVAITLYQLCFPYFTHLVQKEIPLSALAKQPWFLAGGGFVLIFGTLLSGGYSAFVLSSFKAVRTMKGKVHTSVRGVIFRKSLIVFQFVISVGLIVGTITVYQQMLFMKNYEKGYDISQKLVVKAPRLTDENYYHQYENFKNTLQKLPYINQVTASYLAPGDSPYKSFKAVASKKEPDDMHSISLNTVDYDYLKTYNIQLLHGRRFSRDFPADKQAAVITEDFALELGYDPVETALQEKIVIKTPEIKEFTIIGIVKNLNFYSLKLEQRGVVFLLKQDSHEAEVFPITYFTVKLNNIFHLKENLVHLEGLYKSLFPGNPFDYFFLDDYFNAQYQAEEQFGKVFTAASGLAIFIACLGLFGLSAFMVRQRTKEIGIRKVLGASIQNILLLLSKDYIKLVCLAGLIALPIAYFSLKQWLETYMVRIELSWWLFLIPVMIVIGIALCTVSFQTIKAALTNPAKVLQSE